MDRIETLLEAIESCSCVSDGTTTTNPYALCASYPKSESTMVPPLPTDRPKTTAPPGGTYYSYPTTQPKWEKVTDLAKANKVCCACFLIQMRAQGYVPLAHTDLVISNDPEGAQRIIAAYAKKKKMWEESKKHALTAPKPRGQRASPPDRNPLPPVPTNDPPPSTACPYYWDSLRSEFDDNAEFRS